MVYVHIPYCRTHCTYCGFYSELLRRGDSPATQKFVDTLVREIREAAGAGEFNGMCGADTLYIGGGTPSLLTAGQVGRIAEEVKAATDIPAAFEEFTLEVNPDDIVRGGTEYAGALRRAGVDRISMGIQSFDDAVLRRMGRRHNAAEASGAFGILRDAGFDNLSVDLIFGFDPVMEVNSLRDGLERLAGPSGRLPEHVSCYQLSIEPGSALEKMTDRGMYEMPSDEQCEAQYYGICGLLREMGYEHYEISNWALPGHRARHNSRYWNHTPYLGFGPGAHSLIVEEGRMTRRWNNPDLRAYLESGSFDEQRGSETLTPEQLLEERIMLGLRTCEGIPAALADTEKLRAALGRGDLMASLAGVRIPESRWFVSDSIIVNLL